MGSKVLTIENTEIADAVNESRDYLWLGAALLLALLAFSNTLLNGFVFDDHFLIENNQALKNSGYLSRVFKPAPEDSPVMESPSANAGFSAYYRPLTRALFAINYRLFGLNARGWHCVNLALYLLVVTLAFFLFRRLALREEVYGPATLLFALHPIHSESVGWANCLVETFHGLLFLTAFLLFVCRKRSSKNLSIIFFAGSILAALAAIFTKETAVCLPLLISGYVLFIESREENYRTRFKNALLVAIPYLSVILFYLFLRYRAGGSSLQMGAAGRIDLTLRTLPAVLVKYLSLLLLPIDLSPAYPIRPVASFLSAQFWIPLAIVTALVLIAAKYYFRDSSFRSAWLLFLIPLAPVLNVGMLLPELMVQDRYLFLPSLGFCLLGGLLLACLPKQGMVPRRALILLLLVCYGALAIRQNTFWRSDLDLFSHALSVDPKSSFSHINLAGAYAVAGEINDAEQEYTQALRYNPNCAVCFANIAEINYTRGNRKQAVAFYREAIRCGYRDGYVLRNYAVALMEIGELAESIEIFKQVAVLEPRSASAQTNLGKAYLMNGDAADAVESFGRAVAIDDRNAEHHLLLGIAYERSDRRENAINEYQRALLIKQGYGEAIEGLKRLEEK